MAGARRTNNHLYFGKAGHLYIMSELLLRKWNVAMPEVDVGDDIFVVRDEKNIFIKAQVKSANTRMVAGVHRAVIQTSVSQLRNTTGTLIYFFVFRINRQWKVLVVRREELQRLHDDLGVGGNPSPLRINLMLNFYINGNSYRCNNVSFRRYLSDWSGFTSHEQ